MKSWESKKKPKSSNIFSQKRVNGSGPGPQRKTEDGVPVASSTKRDCGEMRKMQTGFTEYNTLVGWWVHQAMSSLTAITINTE